MIESDTAHLADRVVYWSGEAGNWELKPLTQWHRKPPCDVSRSDWNSLLQRWKVHKLTCLWLCEEHASDYGFL
jgi:hypothetical protein